MMMMMEGEGDGRVMDFVRDKSTESSASVNIRSAYNAREERCSDLQPPGRNCMTHRQALQDIPHTNQVLLHKNKKVNFTCIIVVLKLFLCTRTVQFK
jgi:hypothetical protein